MTNLIFHPALAQVASDTTVFVAARDGYDVLIALASGFIAATFLAVLIGLLILFLQARSLVKAIERMRTNFLNDPIVDSARNTAANVEAMSKVARDEFSEFAESMGGVSDRIRQASDRMEIRIEEFNALMKVIQDEAEGAFMDTAATARGVRRGVSRLSEPRLHETSRDGEGRPEAEDAVSASVPPGTTPPDDLPSPAGDPSGAPAELGDPPVPGKLPSPGEGAASGSRPPRQDLDRSTD